MTGFDFFVDLTVTGTVLGLDHTSTPEAVHTVFGGEFSPPLASFGLIEFGWRRREVTYFGAQAHRLGRLTRDDGIEPALVARHGAFPDRIDVDDLRKAVAGQGFPLDEHPADGEDVVGFRAPVSHMGVLAERGSRDVVKLLGPTPHSPWQRFPGQHERFRSYARHLLPLSATERAAWFDNRAENEPDWWGCLAAGAARTPESHRLRLDIHRAATDRGVYPAGEAAATGVRLLLDAGLAPDDAVRDWLATVRHVPGDIAGERRLRDQIHRVEPALPRLGDPELAARLTHWITAKPTLLAGRRD